MEKNERKSISDSLESSEILLSHMPFLLQDLWAMGCSLESIIYAVSRLQLESENSTVLDLGCGKGALSVNIAKEFGLRVLGIDLMEPFLQVAREKAEENHVADRCKFMAKDIKIFTAEEHGYDLAILASLGGIFGSLTKTVSSLRSQVRKNGYFLIDDGYIRNKDSINRNGYEHYLNRKDTLKRLVGFQDEIVMELDTTEESVRINGEYLRMIKIRGEELINIEPGLEAAVTDYIQSQKEECDIINEEIEGRVFIMRKTGID